MEWSPRTTILAQHNSIESSGQRSCRQINVRAWSTREQKALISVGEDRAVGEIEMLQQPQDDFAFLAI